MPGARLTEPQVQRLCTVDAATAARALRALVSTGFLTPLDDGSYGRAEMQTAATDAAAIRSRAGAERLSWRRILCLVDLQNDDGGPSAAAQSALRYAATLAAPGRTHVTALLVVPPSPSGTMSGARAARLPETAQRRAIGMVLAPVWKRVFGDVRRGPVHVRVTAGSPNEELLRVARDIAADLIVLGRGDAGRAVPLARLRELLRQAPCPVLIVHPSGRAAVASPSTFRGDAARA